MGWLGETVDSIKSIQIRQDISQVVSLGMIVTSALIIWKALMVFTGSESPDVVILSGSMEPGFKRGDILFLHMSKDPIRTGEIVVFSIDGRAIPIVHRVIKVYGQQDTGEVDILTKGDNNCGDDRLLCAQGKQWIHHHHIMGRAVGFLPHVGWVTIIMTKEPIIKYIVYTDKRIEFTGVNFKGVMMIGAFPHTKNTMIGAGGYSPFRGVVSIKIIFHSPSFHCML